MHFLFLLLQFFAPNFGNLSDSFIPINDSDVYYEYFQGQEGSVVVLEAGARNNSSSWNTVNPLLQELDISYLAYDRPGSGQSKATNTPRTGMQIAEDLHELLQKLSRI